MKIFLASLLFIMCFHIKSLSQLNAPEASLNRDATIMAEAFVKGDYAKYGEYLNIKILDTIGGSKKLIEALSKSNNNLKLHNILITKIEFGAPSKFVLSTNEIQCVLAQHTELRTHRGIIVVTSYLIAISTDNGMNWNFVDTSNSNIENLRKILPNLSTKLVIPPQQPPIQYND